MDQEPLTEPLTLSMAIARALRYNYDNRMAMMESVLQDKQTQLATLQMMPKLVASAGYSFRDNDMASFSVPVDSQGDLGAFTISQDREKNFADLTLSWNILDLGTSYFQARQQADRFLIAQERQRRVINNIIRQVCDAFYRATMAERLMPRVKTTLADARQALAMNEQIEKERLKPLVQVLQYRKDILAIIDRLNQLNHHLKLAKTGLAALINLPSSQSYSVRFQDNPLFDTPPKIHHTIAELEDLGLYFRHDIREKVYTKRIDRFEKIKQTINLFPGLSLSSSANYDSNSFLMNTNWAEMGVQTSLKLFDLLRAPQLLDVAEARLVVDETSRLALTVAVLVQINIAHQKYTQSLESYEITTQLMSVENRLQKAIIDAVNLKAESSMNAIRQTATTIMATMNRDMAYANTLTAFFDLYATLGIDFYTGPVDTIKLSDLDKRIQNGLKILKKGAFPLPFAALPNGH